jgi:hypothetical protein
VGPEHILARLKAIRDSRMRILALVEGFQTGDPAAWIDVLAAVIHRAHSIDDADAVAALEAITHAAADPALPYVTRKQMYEIAVERRLTGIARIAEQQLKKQLAPERMLRPRGRPLTLGERKALARTHSREELLLLVRDPHPDVVRILLDNPHVTENEIVRIAAQRPAVPESLAIIAKHPRWSLRHAVKRALVFNPSTPLADAIRIATTLRGLELAELAAEPSLPEQLRKHAADLGTETARRPQA